MPDCKLDSPFRSSTREPTQVFTLLETVFKSFDEIAKSKSWCDQHLFALDTPLTRFAAHLVPTERRVFKVETVGDCYVAACGLPEPQRDHATIVVKFAHNLVHNMNKVVKTLETTLGPDTADLGIRIGVHSGPVTAVSQIARIRALHRRD